MMSNGASRKEAVLVKAQILRSMLGVSAFILACQPALPIETMESVGAVKCGGRVKAYEIDFLASESATLEATAKAMAKGASDPTPHAVSSSIDGKTCSEARCGLDAKKGTTYRLAAASGRPKIDDLCIVVARP
jgi:hypothetical protein